MFKSVRTKLIAIILVGSLALAACDKDDDEASGSAAFASDTSILRYVPADSPYVIAALEPLPDDLLDKLEPKLDRILKAYDGLLKQLSVLLVEKSRENDNDEPDLEKVTAVIEELTTLMSLEGMRAAGIERGTTAVFYGNGLFPVLRMQISDGKLFEAALTRIEEKAEQKMSVDNIDDVSYRYVEADKAKVIVAILGNQVVVTLAPTAFDDAQISQLLGLTAPTSNIADAGVLRDIATEYDYTNQYIGYIDIEAIADTLLGTPTGLDKDLFALLNFDDSETTDICRSEVMSLAGIAPRMVMGYKSITAERVHSQFVIELRDDIASGLATLPTAVPGLSGDLGGLMSFGMSLDVKAMRDFYEARLDAIDADPFKCEKLADLQAGAAAGRAVLNQPVPPLVYDFKGFVGVVNEIEGLDLTNNTPPTSVDGRFMLAIDNAPELISFGAMMSPELMGLNLEPNGEPVRVEYPLMAQADAMLEHVFIAMTDDALSVSLGEGVEDELGDMMSANAENNGTFFNFSMDAGRYFAFIGEAMALAEQDEDNPMPAGFQDAMNEVMIAVSELYDRMTVDMRFTERGVEFDSSVTLGE